MINFKVSGAAPSTKVTGTEGDVSPVYSKVVLADSPIAYYRRRDPAGLLVLDQTGLGHNGTIVGTVTDGASALFNDADPSMAFANAGHVSLGSGMNSIFQNHDFSIEAWAFFTVNATENPVLGFDGSGITDGSLHLTRRSTDGGVLRLGFYSDDMLGNTAMTLGQWWAIGCTWAAATKQRIIYLNGLPDKVGTSAGALNCTTPATIGRLFGGGLRTQGLLDDLAIYPYIVAPAQWANHFKTGIGGPYARARIAVVGTSTVSKIASPSAVLRVNSD